MIDDNWWNATRNEEGVVNAVVFAGCSSSSASANKRTVELCKVLYLCVKQ